MIRMQSDALIIDKNDLLTLFDHYGIAIDRNATGTVGLNGAETDIALPWDEACIVVKLTLDEDVSPLPCNNPAALILPMTG